MTAMVAGLLADTATAEAMGVRARRVLESEDISAHAMARQFIKIVPALRNQGEGSRQYTSA